MPELEVDITPDADVTQAEQEVERCAVEEGLTVTLKGTQHSRPGSMHWHFKRGSTPGTLEVTLWPAERRLWLKVAANRGGPWTADCATRMRLWLEKALSRC